MSSDPSGEADAGGGRTPRVAVDVLQRDQRKVLFDGDPDRSPPISPLTEPFASRRALINWWQAACVRTFGHLRRQYPATAIVSDGALTEAVTTADPTPGQAHTRQRLREHVMDACATAYRDLESRAHEWLPGADNTGGGADGGRQDYRQIDPETQEHVAMRPVFTDLDREQARVLRRLWGGFEDRDHVVRWTHGLPAVADFSDILPQGTELTEWIVLDEHCRRQLTSSTETAKMWREKFAAAILLPAFAHRAENLQGGAIARKTRDDNLWNEARE
jgi:hypothetical protein